MEYFQRMCEIKIDSYYLEQKCNKEEKYKGK